MTPRQRLGALCLLGVMILIGLAQVASVSSILPFMAVVSNPEIVETNAWIRTAYGALGFSSTNHFLVFLGFVMLAAIVCVNAVTAFGMWLGTRFNWAVNVHVSRSLLGKYLSQPYLFFVSRNSSDFSSAILQQTGQFTGGFLGSLFQFLTQSVTVLCLFLLVLLVDPLVAIVATAVFGGIYAVIYSALRNRLETIGKEHVTANRARFKAVQEAFGAVKENKILQRERHLIKRYEGPAQRIAKLMIVQQLVRQMPRYVLETMAFGGMVALVIYFLLTRENLAEILPMLGLYSFAGYRMMPALQNAFGALAELRFNQAVVDRIYRDMTDSSPGAIVSVARPDAGRRATGDTSQETATGRTDPLEPASEPLPFSNAIELRGVSFGYPGSSVRVLKEISLTIPFRKSVAFCGPTGSGKTTAVDILLGLLEPDSGGLYVDGVKIDAANRRAWQRDLGYVPQNIYLSDNTVLENVAFGLPPGEIDRDAVKRAARIANIADFIEGELPEGYDTIVGERGMRLSGGQRQRIGIARALYHDPKVLVLDEATSALDSTTETAFINALSEVATVRTVILIAHRLTTVRHCHQIFLLENGRLPATGNYDELLRESPLFRKLAKQDLQTAPDAGKEN